MRVLLGIALVCHAVFSYDAVLFSNFQELSSETPSLDALISGASAEHPLIFLAEPDFTLGLFNRHASVYQVNGKASPLAQLVRETKYSTQRHLDATYFVPNAQGVSQTAEYQEGSSIYLVSADDWALLEELSINVLPKVKSFTAVLTASEAVSQSQERVKRLVTDLEEERGERAADAANDGKEMQLPVTLPPYNRSEIQDKIDNLGCFLYMEGVSIIATKKQGEVPSGYPSAAATVSGENGTFFWNNDYVSCVTPDKAPGVFKFQVNMAFKDAVTGTNVGGPQFTLKPGSVNFELIFKEDPQYYWSLTKFTLLDNIMIDAATSGSKPGFITQPVQTDSAKNGTASGLSYMGVDGVIGYAWNCGDSAAAWFTTNDESVLIGVAFHNFQVQLRNIRANESHYFDTQVVDCVPTFSTGSLMGIVSSLVMLSIFLFGFLMLNSVQTMDRFDDPKQKQILINVRE